MNKIQTTKTNRNLKTIAVLLLVLMTIFSSFSVMAASDKNPSPHKKKEYVLIIKPQKGGVGYRRQLSKELTHLEKIVAKPKNGYRFTHWTIEGKYEFVKGDLNSSTAIIRLYSDCVATPHFVNKEGKEEQQTVKTNQSNISPKTGPPSMDDMAPIVLTSIIAYLLLAVGACVYEMHHFNKKMKVKQTKE